MATANTLRMCEGDVFLDFQFATALDLSTTLTDQITNFALNVRIYIWITM